jgi:hypothetical protein
MIRHLILVGILGLGLVACGDDVGTAPRIALDAGLAGVDAGAIDAEATGSDASPATNTIPPCVPCVIDVSDPAWHVSSNLDMFVLSTGGVMPGVQEREVCRLVRFGAPWAGTWTVADTGSTTGYPSLVRSDAPMTCEANR